MNSTGTKERPLYESSKTIALGVFCVIAAVWFWHYLIGNPLDDLALLRKGQAVPGFIVDTWEEAGDDDRGRAVWLHGAVYTYRLPDGREFKQRTKDKSGRLDEKFRNLKAPYAIEVEYLPENPSVSQIKGEGSDSILEWLWRKLGLGLLLLAMFLSPGVFMLVNGVRRIKKRKTKNLFNET